MSRRPSKELAAFLSAIDPAYEDKLCATPHYFLDEDGKLKLVTLNQQRLNKDRLPGTLTVFQYNADWTLKGNKLRGSFVIYCPKHQPPNLALLMKVTKETVQLNFWNQIACNTATFVCPFYTQTSKTDFHNHFSDSVTFNKNDATFVFVTQISGPPPPTITKLVVSYNKQDRCFSSARNGPTIALPQKQDCRPKHHSSRKWRHVGNGPPFSRTLQTPKENVLEATIYLDFGSPRLKEGQPLTALRTIRNNGKKPLYSVPYLTQHGLFAFLTNAQLQSLLALSGKQDKQQHDKWLANHGNSAVYRVYQRTDLRGLYLRVSHRVSVHGPTTIFREEHIRPFRFDNDGSTKPVLSCYTTIKPTKETNITTADVKVASKAFTSTGGYGPRKCSQNKGVQAYLGLWRKGNKSSSSPSQGKHESHYHAYNKQNWKPALAIDGTTTIRRLSNTIQSKYVECDHVIGKTLFAYANKVDQSPTRIKFITLPKLQNLFGYCNTTHLDIYDRLTKQVQDRIRQEFLPYCVATRTQHVQHCAEYLKTHDTAFHGFSVPTTCGYRFIWDSLQEQQSYLVHQYFMHDGIDTAVKIYDNTLLFFYGAAHAHHTSLCVLENKTTGRVHYTNTEQNHIGFTIMAFANAAAHNDHIDNAMCCEATSNYHEANT